MILRRNSLLIIRSLEILRIENSEVKTQNSSILAIGNVTPRINKINSIKLKKMKMTSIILLILTKNQLKQQSQTVIRFNFEKM